MSQDPEFEISADMRLLELQRSALGLTAPDRTRWETRYTAESSPGLETPLEEVKGRSAVLSVEATAAPSSGVIPGAVVTVSLSIANEGATPALNIVAAAPLPGGGSYRAGSFLRDGRSSRDDEAEHFFGNGVLIHVLAPGARATFIWKLGVRLGTKPLVIAPQVRAEQGAVIGARPLSIGRKDQSASLFSAELSRTDPALYEPKPLIAVEIPADDLPFYELDAEEEIIHEAVDAALSSQPRSDEVESSAPPESLIQVPTNELRAVSAAPDPQTYVSETKPETTEPPREAVILYSGFDRATVSFFERTFNGSKAPTILSHCILGSALACSVDAEGNDSLALKRHLDAQSQVLHRIQLHERLGKKEPIAEYAGQLLAALDRIRPVPLQTGSFGSDVIMLETELSEPTLGVIAKIQEDRDRWDFVKARQLTLALQAQRVAGLAPDSPAAVALENALRVYAQTAMTTLQKLFVRLRIDRTTGVLFQNEPQLDVAARALVAAFAAALKK